MEQKIKDILSSVLNVEVTKIDENSSPDSIEAWDSLNHLNLMMALEEEFNIKFSGDEIGEMMNYKLINLIINEKIKSL